MWCIFKGMGILCMSLWSFKFGSGVFVIKYDYGNVVDVFFCGHSCPVDCFYNTKLIPLKSLQV